MSETPPKNVKVTKQPNWKSKDSKPTGQHGKSKGSHKTHQLGEVDLEQDVEDNTYGMYSLSEPYFKGTNPYEITVNVDGKPLVMELDTGAAVSVIGETPSGVSSAPGIFQRTMDSMLQGFPGVVCYLDDILVTGKTTKEYRDNLERVLKRLEEAGVG